MSKRKLLTLTRIGNPILREAMPQVALADISSSDIQDLIADIRYTNQQKSYGVGLAAPQVGCTFGVERDRHKANVEPPKPGSI